MLRWIKKNAAFTPLAQKETSDAIIVEIAHLATSTGSWQEMCTSFEQKWRPMSSAFIKYMTSTYLQDNALHPPTIWAVSRLGEIPHPDQTNNEAERFNKTMNESIVKKKPDLKQCVAVLHATHGR